MMPQEEVNAAIHKQADPVHGRYEGTQNPSARHLYESSYEQEAREGLSGKAYPLPHENANILRFFLAVIALGLILLFGLLFVVRIGGTTGWASFAVAGFVIMVITGVSIDKIR